MGFKAINLKDQMTKIERVKATVNFLETDRVCLFDLLHNPGMIKYFANTKLKLKINKEDNLKIVGKAISNSLDLVRHFLIPDVSRTEKRKDGFVIRFQEWTSWIEQRPFLNVRELKDWVKRNICEVNNWKPGEQWTYIGKGTVDRGANEKIYNYKERFLKRKEVLGDTVLFHDESPVGLDTAMDLAGIELFTYLYFEEPDLVSDWLEVLNLHEVKRVRYEMQFASELSPVALPYCDLAYKNGLIFSPDFLRKEFFPRLKRLCDVWHEFGIKCIFHSDGNYMEVMDDFVKAGVDGINPIEPLSGWDLVDVRSKYPNLVLMGNIDASQLLPFGSRNDVKKAVKKAIDDIYPTGGLIIASSTELHPSVKAENGIIMNLFAKEYSRVSPFKPREIDEIKIDIK
ncbi:MAG: uroporphyrinogen decarboxylase family protein [Candidatus Humimicrobiaceae bacterium]